MACLCFSAPDDPLDHVCSVRLGSAKSWRGCIFLVRHQIQGIQCIIKCSMFLYDIVMYTKTCSCSHSHRLVIFLGSFWDSTISSVARKNLFASQRFMFKCHSHLMKMLYESSQSHNNCNNNHFFFQDCQWADWELSWPPLLLSDV